MTIVGNRVKDDEEAMKAFLEALREAGHKHVLNKLYPTIDKHGM